MAPWPIGFSPRRFLASLEGEPCTVLAAVSGGSDSVALLHVLARVLPRAGHGLEVAHVHHGVRGADANADAAFVQELAARLDLPCHVLSVGALVAHDEGTLREARLELLRALSLQQGAHVIAFGQQQEDAAETFLLMALRGSGAAGLGSLRADRYLEDSGIRMLRPLLRCNRAHLREWLENLGEKWREDASNAEPRYRRNRLRHEVMPLLAEIEPGAIANLAQSAELCAGAADSLTIAAAMLGRHAILGESGGTAIFNVNELRNAPPVVAAELLRRYWQRASGGPNCTDPRHLPTRQLLDELMERISDQEGDELEFVSGRTWVLCNNKHLLLSNRDSEVGDVQKEMPGVWPMSFVDQDGWEEVLPSSWMAAGLIKRLPDGTAIETQLYGSMQDSFSHWLPLQIREGQRVALLELDGAPDRLRLATVDPGVRISLKGGGHRRASDWLFDLGIFIDWHHRVVGLYLDDELLWIPGVCRSGSRWVTSGTKRTAVLRWNRQRRLT